MKTKLDKQQVSGTKNQHAKGSTSVKSARNKFHEQSQFHEEKKSTCNKFHEQNQFHEQKKFVQASRREKWNVHHVSRTKISTP